MKVSQYVRVEVRVAGLGLRTMTALLHDVNLKAGQIFYHTGLFLFFCGFIFHVFVLCLCLISLSYIFVCIYLTPHITICSVMLCLTRCSYLTSSNP
jgi:hypothetical protein